MMTYLDLVNRFWCIDVNYNFSHLEIHLYFKLLDLTNRTGWRKKLSVPNSRMCGVIGTTEKYLIKARKRLIDTEVIQYEKGTTRKAGKYIIDPDYFQMESNKASNKNDSFPIESNGASNLESNKASNLASNEGYLYKTRKEKTREDTNTKGEKEKIPFQEIKNLFNLICTSQSKILKTNPEREKHIRARWKWLDSLEKWEEYFRKIEDSAFLRSSSKTRWMGFDWVINETNMTKILEGKYDDKEVSDGGFSEKPRKANETDRIKNPSGQSTDYDEIEKLLVCKPD